MAKKTVEQELLEATGVKPKAKEKRQDYLKRLLGAAGELDDEAWKKLSTPTQKWYNDATKAFDDDEELPNFDAASEAPAEPKKGAKGKAAANDADDDADDDDADGDDETSGEADEDSDDAEPEDKAVKPAKKPAKGKAEKPAAKPAKGKAEKPAKKAARKSNGAVQFAIGHLLKNPDAKAADVMAALKKEGITATDSTVASALGFTKVVVRVMQDKKLTSKVIFKD